MKKLLAISALALGFTNLAHAENLLDVADESGGFTTFLKAVKTAGLEETLKGKGPLTLFAPDDAAFAKLPKDKLSALLANKDALKKVLNNHIVDHKVSKADVDAGKVKSMDDQELTLSVTEGVKVDGARVTGAAIEADNGVIHEVTAVLIPKNVHL